MLNKTTTSTSSISGIGLHCNVSILTEKGEIHLFVRSILFSPSGNWNGVSVGLHKISQRTSWALKSKRTDGFFNPDEDTCRGGLFNPDDGFFHLKVCIAAFVSYYKKTASLLNNFVTSKPEFLASQVTIKLESRGMTFLVVIWGITRKSVIRGLQIFLAYFPVFFYGLVFFLVFFIIISLVLLVFSEVYATFFFELCEDVWRFLRGRRMRGFYLILYDASQYYNRNQRLRDWKAERVVREAYLREWEKLRKEGNNKPKNKNGRG